MVIVVLGATGEMGSSVAGLLEERGHTVRRAARSTGVDAVAGTQLATAFDGADVVVDCLNITSQRRATAVPFFVGTARRVTAAAAASGVRHLVVLSIVNVSDPRPRRFTGYYAGKAAQEAVYAESEVPVSLVRTTAWFSLARMFLDMAATWPGPTGWVDASCPCRCRERCAPRSCRAPGRPRTPGPSGTGSTTRCAAAADRRAPHTRPCSPPRAPHTLAPCSASPP